MWLASLACRSGPDGDLPSAYRRIEVPEARLASPAAAERGDALFQQFCVLCHGRGGAGDGLQSFGLDPKPRDLTRPEWRDSTSPRRVYYAIREGVHGTAMPGWKALTEDEAWDLTAFVLSLASR